MRTRLQFENIRLALLKVTAMSKKKNMIESFDHIFRFETNFFNVQNLPAEIIFLNGELHIIIKLKSFEIGERSIFFHY